MKDKEKTVRRGFDINEELYNEFRSEAISKGQKPKAFLARALRREIARSKKRKLKKVD